MTSLHKLLALLIFASSTPVYSLNADVEHQQKTKLVRYIINKVSWPSGSVPKNNFTLCVLGNDNDLNIVEKLNGQIIQKRRIIVKVLKAKELSSSCQLIYIGDEAATEQKNLISKFSKKPVLLLGDIEHFASLGGSMNFAILENTVALTLNLESMNRSKLVMASEELDNVIVVPEEKDLK